jgi:hypothetical protein
MPGRLHPFKSKISQINLNRYLLASRAELTSASYFLHSYQMAPRATIFRRDAGQVETMADMRRIMRSNDYPSDPYVSHASSPPAPIERTMQTSAE